MLFVVSFFANFAVAGEIKLQAIDQQIGSPYSKEVGPSILIFGDSLSAAYGLDQSQGWVHLLAEKLQQNQIQTQVFNASVSGETTGGGLQRLPELLEIYQPNFIVIELGANDALRGQNLKITKQNLRKMIELSQAIGAKVMLLGIRLPTNYGAAYDQALQNIYKDLAGEFQLPLDPFFLADVALDNSLMQSDGLHPNAKAQPLILQRLYPQIVDFIR